VRLRDRNSARYDDDDGPSVRPLVERRESAIEISSGEGFARFVSGRSALFGDRATRKGTLRGLGIGTLNVTLMH
jgi:hypothetical protein